MSIQQNIEHVNHNLRVLHEAGQLEKRVLAVGIEMNQRYLEYLEELETAPLEIRNGVDVEVDGQVIHFSNLDDFSDWISHHDR